jgi:hypothetical protein
MAFTDWQTGEHDGTSGLEFQLITNSTTDVEVRRGSADATHMIIPETVTVNGVNYTVTRITSSGFSGFTTMTEEIFIITDAEDFITRFPQIVEATNRSFTTVIINVPSIGIDAAQLATLTTLISNLENATLNWTDIYPTIQGILIRHQNWTLLQEPPLRAHPYRWRANQADLPMFDEATQSHAIALRRVLYSCDYYGLDGQILLHPSAAFADTIVWNRHLADATNLEIAANWHPRQVQVFIEQDPTLPWWCGAKALGGTTDLLFRRIHTPNVRNPQGNLIFSRHTMFSSFSRRRAFDPNTSMCGYPAAPMRISELGDSGDTNWAFTHMVAGWAMIGSDPFVPHVESSITTGQDAGKIFFVPYGHHTGVCGNPNVDHCCPDVPGRSRYSPLWFGNMHSFFKFGTLNGVELIIPMDQIVFASTLITGNTPEARAQSAFNMMTGWMTSDTPHEGGVRLPTFQDVIAESCNHNTRGGANGWE